MLTNRRRAAHPLVLEYCKARNDRHGPQSNYAYPCKPLEGEPPGELLQELYKPDVLEDLLKESELVIACQKEVVGMVQALNKAEECVLFLFPYMLRCVRIDNNSLFTGLWRVSEGGLPIPSVVHVLILSSFFPPLFLRVIANDRCLCLFSFRSSLGKL